MRAFRIGARGAPPALPLSVTAAPDTREALADAMAGVVGGDALALRRLYALTSAKLFSVCLRISGDEGEAEETLQDVYLTLWKRPERYDPARGAPMTWLIAVARNRSLDRVRSRRSRRHETLDAVDEHPDPAPDAAAVLLADEDARRLQACLDTLDPRTAAAIRTAFEEGVSYEALAMRAGVPVGTMKSWIRRGLLKLREGFER